MKKKKSRQKASCNKYISTETDKKRRQKDLRLQRVYGITLLEWERKLTKQQNACGLCSVVFTGRANTDHIHVKGFKTRGNKQDYIRAILCFTCNVMIGKLERRKNPREMLEKINLYFKKYKMRNDPGAI